MCACVLSMLCFLAFFLPRNLKVHFEADALGRWAKKLFSLTLSFCRVVGALPKRRI